MIDDVNIFIAKNDFAVAEKALSLLLAAAEKSISRKGSFVLSLAGGNTPKTLYELLAKTNQDWDKWFLIYGDERCLAENNAARNSVLVQTIWLNGVNFPTTNHFIIDYLPDTEVDEIAKTYSNKIRHLLPIDFALLGIGEDGHTASLFPHNIINDRASSEIAIAIHYAPKPPSKRVSLSYRTLCNANEVCFIVSGLSKNKVLKAWNAGEELPVSYVKGTAATFLIADENAAI